MNDDRIKNGILKSFERECDFISQIDAPEYQTSAKFQSGISIILRKNAKKPTWNELVNDQSHRNQVNEKKSSRKEEVVLRPKYYRLEPPSKSPLKKVIIAVAAVVCVVTAGVFVGVNSKRQMIPSDRTSSEGPQSNSENSSGYSEENIVVAENAVDIKTATESYNADFEQCKNTDYTNLDWTNAGKCPVYPVSELYNAEYTSTLATAEISSQSEMLDKFKVYCNSYFGECLDDFAFFRAVADETTVMLPDTPPVIVNGVSYSSFHRISDYKEKIEDGSIKLNFLVYRNIEKNQYLWWCYGAYPHWINKGVALTAIGDSTNKCSSWLPSDLGELVARYYNNGKNNDVKYKLLDGEVSIGEAIRYFTEEYPETLPFEDKPSYSVKYVEVYKLTEDTYAYMLNAATQYNSVSFEVQPEMTTYGSAPNYFTRNGQALMIKKNDIDVTLNCDPITNIQDVGREITKIIPLKNAADIVSKKLSQAVKFDVVSTDLIYHGATEEKKETKESVTILKPTWIFVLYNSNDGSYYNAYVDAVSGEFDYYSYNI